MSRQILIALLVLFIGAFLSFTSYLIFEPKSIYWGAFIKGNTYDLGDAPWNTTTIDMFELHAQKKLSILHWGQPWWHCYFSCGYQPFRYQVAQYDLVRNRGYIPLVDWASWDFAVQPQHDQPDFALSTIIRGDHDTHIREWATEAKHWGHPFFLRFNWEMNGHWYPWSEKRNGNQPGEFVQAWRHVHEIFREVGASNVTWVWCPNVLYNNSIPLEQLYPGDAYVDWTCMDGYNSGTHPANPDRWRRPNELFAPTYEQLLEIAPAKPIMIAEVASTEVGGSKAAWISDFLTVQLPHFFSRVEAVVWFNWNHGGMDWAIESSLAAQEAFAEGVSSSYYAENEFADIDSAPIPSLPDLRHARLLAIFKPAVEQGSDVQETK